MHLIKKKAPAIYISLACVIMSGHPALESVIRDAEWSCDCYAMFSPARLSLATYSILAHSEEISE